MAVETKIIYTCDGCELELLGCPIGRLYTKNPSSYGYWHDNIIEHHFCTECTHKLEEQFNIKHLKKKAP